MSRFLLPLLIFAMLGVFLGLSASAPSAEGAEAKPGEQVDVKISYRLLGSDSAISDATIWVLVRGKDANTRFSFKTDAKGEATIKVRKGGDYRLFASADRFIPYSWSKITAKNFADGSKEVYARTTERITISGTLYAKDGEIAKRAHLEFIPLDRLEDGSFTSYHRPFIADVDHEGKYSIEIPAGYYDYFGRWADRSTEHWDPWLELRRGQGLFKDQKVDLKLVLRPIIKGQIIDGRSGKPCDARIDLITSDALRQPRLRFKSDHYEDNRAEEEIGVFEDHLSEVDHKSFTMVIRAATSNSAIRVLPGMSLAKVLEQKTFKLYDPARSHVSVVVKTKDKGFRIAPGMLNLVPVGFVEVPGDVRPDLQLVAKIDDKGVAEFWGAPKGSYGLYNGVRNPTLLGDIEVDDGEVTKTIEIDMAFAFGSLQYPDGSKVEHADYEIVAIDQDGNRYESAQANVFKNPWMKARDQYLIPLNSAYAFEIVVGAPKKGAKETHWDLLPKQMPFTKSFKVERGMAGGKEVNIKLELNKNAKKSRDEED